MVSLAAAGGGHVTGAGDDVATAFVAGAAALVRSYRPELDADGVRRRLLDTADRAPGPGHGRGVVDPYRALTAVLTDGAVEVARTAVPLPDLAVQPVRSDERLRTAFALAGGVLLVLLVAAAAVAVRRRPRTPRDHPRTPSG